MHKEKLTEYAQDRPYSKYSKAKSKIYLENNKESLQKQAWESYKKLSEEEKDKTKKCRRMPYRNTSDEDKQK